MENNYTRPVFNLIKARLFEKRRYIQVLLGPRQVGKTSLSLQLLKDWASPHLFLSADDPTLRDRNWLEQQWETARHQLAESKKSEFLLVIDEIQKITNWSEVVKKMWDEDSRNNTPIKILLLGSATLTMQTGLTESLAGRFEIIPITHWSYSEMKAAFDFSLDQFLYFGGYPGAATLIEDQNRWRQYILDSLIETTMSRDIFLVARVDKPALLRRLFKLGCDYSGQILSYQKMLGQLQDAGNTTTLAHYLDLLEGAGLIAGVSKYAGQKIRQRGSSPKLVALNTALMNATSELDFMGTKNDFDHWGRIVETAVGAHLYNESRGKNIHFYYWLDRSRELDYVVSYKKNLVAIEVKSGRKKGSLPGLEAFSSAFPVKKKLLIGKEGISLESFLSSPLESWLGE